MMDGQKLNGIDHCMEIEHILARSAALALHRSSMEGSMEGSV